MSTSPEQIRAQLLAANGKQKIPAAHADPTSPEFDSLDAAAHAFSKAIGGGAEAEQAGVLYSTPKGKFVYSIPTTQHEQDGFSLRAMLANGNKLAGIVHSHPGEDEFGQVFSPKDIDVASQLKVPSYVLFMKDGAVRKYVHGQTPTSKMAMPGSAFSQKVSRGIDVPDPSVQTAAAGPLMTANESPTQSVKVEGNSMSDPTTATPSLSSLYTTNPGTQDATASTAANPTAAPVTNATAGTVSTGGVLSQAKDYTAAQNTVDPDQLASTQLSKITSEDSPLMEQARQSGLNTANSRGMINSSLAAGNAEAEMVKQATPIAQQNAATEANSSLANQAATNQASAQNASLDTQSSEQNASVNAQINELQAQMQTAVSQGNASAANAIAEQLQQLQTQTDQFNAAQKTSVSQSNAAATNAMTSQVLQANSDMNKQYLAGTQSMDLATIQGRYQNLIAQNAAAASLYNSYFQSISETMSNTNLDPARAAQIVAVQQQTLAAGLALMDSMNGLDATGSPTAPGGTAAPGGPPPVSIQPVTGKPFNAAGGEAAGTNANLIGGALTGAGSLATGASKIGALNGTTTGSVLGAAGNVASGLGGAAGIVGGIQQGGVKGVGGVLAGGAQLASSLGYGGTVTNAAGLVGNLASGNIPGVIQSGANLVSGLSGGGSAGLTTAQAAAQSAAAQSAGASGAVTASGETYSAPTAFEAASETAPEGAAGATAAGAGGMSTTAALGVAGIAALPALIAASQQDLSFSKQWMTDMQSALQQPKTSLAYQKAATELGGLLDQNHNLPLKNLAAQYGILPLSQSLDTANWDKDLTGSYNIGGGGGGATANRTNQY